MGLNETGLNEMGMNEIGVNKTRATPPPLHAPI